MKKLIRVALAALMATAGAVIAAQPASADVDVHITPGEHTVNGRQWRTTCEPYSVTHRCRTEIWGTTIKQVNGRFVQQNGWMFNTLTYRQSPRSKWVGNPLAANGQDGVVENFTWTATDGRQWRTECNTPTTGRGGCRNYVKADVIASTPRGYRWQRQTWILNSMVRFGPVQPLEQPAEPEAPDVVLEDQPIVPIDPADVPDFIAGMDAWIDEEEGTILYSTDPDTSVGALVMAFGDLGFDVSQWSTALDDPATVNGAVCGTDPDFGEPLCVFESAKYGHTFVFAHAISRDTLHLVTTTLMEAMG